MGANAVTTVPVYTAGEVLTAADLNITNSGIPVFATTVTRDAAFGGTGEKTLAEGQFAYIEATDQTQYYSGSSWLALGGKLGQVLSVTKTDSFTTTSTTYTDLTSLTLTITPSATTSKVLVMYTVQGSGVSGANMGGIQILRGATAIGNADAAGSRSVTNTVIAELGAAQMGQVANAYLDSPSTTSATTYKLQIRTLGAGGTTIYVNRTNTDTDNAAFGRGTSTLTLFEVLA
jgi:hypothetical protein